MTNIFNLLLKRLTNGFLLIETDQKHSLQEKKK